MTATLAAAGIAQAAPTPPLSHAGRWITDGSGRVVVVHGINMVYKLPPYYPAKAGFGDDDAAFLAHIGFNAVRVGVIWKALEPSPGHYNDAYVAQIAQTVRTLARHGVLSLLDFHQDMYNEQFQGEGAPDWAVQDGGLPNFPKAGFPANYLVNPAVQHAFDQFWANAPGPGGVGLEDRFAARLGARRDSIQADAVGARLRDLQRAVAGNRLGAVCPDRRLPGVRRQAAGRSIERVFARVRTVDRRTLVWYEPNVLFNGGPNTQPRADR